MRRLATSVLAMSACALVMSCGGVDAPPPSTAGVGLQAPNSPLVTLRVMV